MTRIVAVACGLFALLWMLPALGGGFLIWDDNVNLLSNPSLWQPAGGAIRWMFTDVESVQRYKPVCWLMWWLTGNTFGLDPLAFHALNLVLHGGNTLLLFQVIHNFLTGKICPNASSPMTARIAASAGALWWAVHPLRVEPVAWISGAGYPLSTFFALLALLAFQSRSGDYRAQTHWYAVVLFGFSLLSYPAAAALPALLAALSVLDQPWANADTTQYFRRLGSLLAPYLILAAIVLGLTLITRLTTDGEIWNRPASLTSVGMGTRLIQAFAIWGWYLQKTLVPWHLSPVYPDFWAFSPSSPSAIGSLLALLLISAGAWRIRSRCPEVPVLWAAFLLLAVPVLGIADLPFSPADRYTYVPSLALALLFASVLCRALTVAGRFGRTLAASTTGIVLVASFTVTQSQLKVWTSPVTFFRHAIASVEPNPAAADLHWRLGLHYLTMDESRLAQEEFAATLRLNPHQVDAARYLRVLRQRAEATRDQPDQAGSKGKP